MEPVVAPPRGALGREQDGGLAPGVERAAAAVEPPPEGTVQRWAFDYVTTADLAQKLAPPEIPERWEPAPPARRLARPGRPAGLVAATKSPKSPGPEALRDPARRAALVHTFLHHELQAAELMAWALLAFPETPRAFQRGLLGVLADEVRHMGLYREHLARLGHAFGDFPVRDWFWERVPSAASPASFVAVMGVGFEGGNLDHAARFAERFRAAGDAIGAAIQEEVCEEEIAHVRFARRWIERFAGACDYATWRALLPPPISPLVMRGDPMNRAARARAGLSPELLDEIAAYRDEPRSAPPRPSARTP